MNDVDEEPGKPGRPPLYSDAVIELLLTAIAAGMFYKDACARAGISVSVLANWRDKHPELETRMAEAREEARQKALEGIRGAGENGDWRASEAWLRLSFPEYRQNAKVEVGVGVSVQQNPQAGRPNRRTASRVDGPPQSTAGSARKPEPHTGDIANV